MSTAPPRDLGVRPPCRNVGLQPDVRLAVLGELMWEMSEIRAVKIGGHIFGDQGSETEMFGAGTDCGVSVATNDVDCDPHQVIPSLTLRT